MKRLFSLALLTVAVLLLALPVSAKSEAYRYVSDGAGVLSAEEAATLDGRLTELSEALRFDIVVVTATGVRSGERMAYADDFFDYNGYGYGTGRDGILLLVNVPSGGYSTGNSWVSTSGSGIDYFSDEDIQDIGSLLTPLLLKGQYSQAFLRFADTVSDTVTTERIGKRTMIIGICAVVALVAAFLYAGKLKRDLISVRAATEANHYLVDGSFHLRRSFDLFLYSHVIKTERKSSSGSSTHTSSSGSSHGGGGF